MATESPEERVERMNRAAEAERGPHDPRPIKRRDVRPLILLACAAFAVAVAVIVWMFVSNP